MTRTRLYSEANPAPDSTVPSAEGSAAPSCDMLLKSAHVASGLIPHNQIQALSNVKQVSYLLRLCRWAQWWWALTGT